MGSARHIATQALVLVAGAMIAVSARAQPEETIERLLAWTERQPERRQAPHATWQLDRAAGWMPRPEGTCLAELRRRGIPYRPLGWRSRFTVAPIRLVGAVDGVTFRLPRRDAPLHMACEMALRLPDIAAVVARHDVHTVGVLVSWRRIPRGSYHYVGLALDIDHVETTDGTISVEEHFPLDPSRPTCAGEPRADPRARLLHSIACELFATGRLSTVLTPNYNEGHRDHLHVDIRPGDGRLFLR